MTGHGSQMERKAFSNLAQSNIVTCTVNILFHLVLFPDRSMEICRTDGHNVGRHLFEVNWQKRM